jgi:deoxyribodipyrimidine photo-lyase
MFPALSVRRSTDLSRETGIECAVRVKYADFPQSPSASVFSHDWINRLKKERLRRLNDHKTGRGPILYWMSREQRVADNWALIAAQEAAAKINQPLVVVFALAPSFLGATWRHYDFMLKGLRETETALRKLNVPFFLLNGQPEQTVPNFARKMFAGAVVTDFTPLRIGRLWREKVARSLEIPLIEVDSRNIVPCWVASEKAEFAARTFRPKINRMLNEYLDPFPEVVAQSSGHGIVTTLVNWGEVEGFLNVDKPVPECTSYVPGEAAAAVKLEEFLARIDGYDPGRNRPDVDLQSGLSPYLHFGHISAQRIAGEVMDRTDHSTGAAAFVEELVVRRELSDNFCLHNQNYDSFDCFPDWAKQTLDLHRGDPREFLYTLDQFEAAETHDPLWNAAQQEMCLHGKMHGYMRMYWAKKILEWSESPEDALTTAIYLNDRYELDGRESSGYVGIAWSIGGVHDRPWFDRPVYGTVRYMNYNGAKSKFDVDAYIRRVNNA